MAGPCFDSGKGITGALQQFSTEDGKAVDHVQDGNMAPVRLVLGMPQHPARFEVIQDLHPEITLRGEAESNPPLPAQSAGFF